MVIILESKFSELKQHLADKAVPVSVLWEISGRCNLICSHCARKNSTGELNTDMALDVLDQLAASGVLELAFSGGEPLVRNDFPDLLAHAVDHGFAVTVMTNGTLIDEKMADILAGHHLAGVDLSIYSMNEEIHDRITGVPGSCLASKRAVRLLRQRDIRCTVKSLVLDGTESGIDDIASFCRDNACRHQTDTAVFPRDGGDPAPLAGISRVVDDSPPSMSCTMGQCQCAISADGDVFPCVTFRRSAGNLRFEKFQHIWYKSDLFQIIRKNGIPGLGDECASCSQKTRCAMCPGFALSMQNAGCPAAGIKEVPVG